MPVATLTYQRESFVACWPELAPLVRAHHAERSETTPLLPLEVDDVLYAALEVQGRLVLVTLRGEAGLLGYTLSLLMPHLHSRDRLCVVLDTYYVAPAYRKGGAARDLLAATEATWATCGVTRAYMAAPDVVLGRWLRHQGWTEDSVTYRKDL
jgi:hypothetical protein